MGPLLFGLFVPSMRSGNRIVLFKAQTLLDGLLVLMRHDNVAFSNPIFISLRLEFDHVIL